MKVAVIGNGRMGQILARLCREAGHELAGLVGPGDTESVEMLGQVEAAIDFSYPGNLEALLKKAQQEKFPLVIGTTGYTARQVEEIEKAAKTVPVVYASNYSTGVTVMNRLVREAARVLGDFDVEIVETHHRMKVDAPSGTAKSLLASVDPEGRRPVLDGRSGIVGQRGDEIGMHALRGGTVAGEHRVLFFGEKEELEIRHRADDREIFARGAMRALAFAAKAKPGLYNMEDVLFGGTEQQ
ncbi:MAG: 4-hydroxy-tetrahydrodipicolinate reductase [Clostridia bacterium]|nr:4-hydroxy-tetrahydrodipicolinate reductase [Clostridia bacterium]